MLSFVSSMKRILILAANPSDSSRLRLDKEVREIQDVLRRAKQRELFEIKTSSATRPSDIQQELLDYTPQIVHFCGHGTGTQGLVFEDNNGKSQFVSSRALANLFKLFSDQVECVVLNACYSDVQAEAIVKHIDAVIGMVQPIGDTAAIRFSEGFYRGIGNGKNIEFSYRLGLNSLELQSIPNEYIPVLKRKEVTMSRKPREIDTEDKNLLVAIENKLVPPKYKTDSEADTEGAVAAKKSKMSFFPFGNNRVLAFILVPILLFALSFAAKGRSTTIKVPEKDNDEYYYELLELALKKGAPNQKFNIEKVEIDEPQVNLLSETDDKTIDVAWMMTNREREYYTRPVRIPLTGGLLAYRICIVSKENKDVFDDVENLDDFKAEEHSIGQVHDWPDTRILREAGIDVKSSDGKPNIFRQLESGEIDCFARGVSEIWTELEPYANLTLDENILFKYTSPVYFFVSNDNEKLEKIIDSGLKAAIDDGEYCDLLMDHYGKAIRVSKLSERKPINLENRDLPDITPTEYYLNFDSAEHAESRGECD